MKKQGSAFHFLGLNAADTNPNARVFLKRYGWTWPSIIDSRRTLARRFSVDYQPAVILIDARGRFVAGFAGRGTPQLWDQLKSKLATQ